MHSNSRLNRRRFSLLLLSGVTALLAGCNNGGNTDVADAGADGAGKPVEVTFWHTQTQENKTALEELVRRFNESHPDIVVKPVWQGDYRQNYQKLLAAINAGSPPEMAVSYGNQIAEYMKANAVVPLDSYVSGEKGLSKEELDDFFPAFLEASRHEQFDNQLLSFPFTKSLLVSYVNMDALERAGIAAPPTTWAEFKDAAVKLTRPQQGSLPPMKGMAVDINASTIDGWIMSHGGTLMDASGNGANFDSPETLATYRDIEELFKKGAAYQTKGDVHQADFGSQRAGIVHTSSTGRNTIGPLVNNKFDWRITMIPQTDPSDPKTVLYGADIAVFKTTPEKQAAAWEFIKWLTQKEQAAYWTIHSSYMPIRKSVAELPDMQEHWKTKDPQGKQAFDLLKYAKTEPNVRGWQDVRDAIEESMQEVISGTKAPEQAVKDLDAAADKAIQGKS